MTDRIWARPVFAAGSLVRRVGQLRSIVPVLPSLIILGFILMAVLAPVLAPHSPIQGSLENRLLPPLLADQRLLGVPTRHRQRR